MKKIALVFLAAVIFSFSLSACSKKDKQGDELLGDVEPPRGEDIIDEGPDLSNKAINPLTGLYIDNEIAERRPIAVMINNHHKALPQSGISQADIIYEVLAEGEVTRLVALFSDFSSEKIGPVRSTRDYYGLIALDNNAVFAHHGGSDGGYQFIRNNNLDAFDGMHDEKTFFRDKTRLNTPGMYEHSSYTSAERLLDACERNDFQMEQKSTYIPVFNFNDDFVMPIDAQEAKNIVLNYSYYQISGFEYDEQSKLYIRSQSGKPHIDEETGEALSFSNIIIQYTKGSIIDNEGRRSFELIGSGEGLYITGGKAQRAKWIKDSRISPTRWLLEDGTGLLLNPGKTNVCVMPDNIMAIIEQEGEQEQ